MTASTDGNTCLSQHITLQRLHNGRLHVFEVSDNSDQEIDLLFHTVYGYSTYCVEHNVAWLAMYCLSKFLPPTPYHRQRLAEWGRAFPQLRGREVVVAPPSPLMMLMRILIPLMRFHQRGIERRIMQDRDKAIAWLEELL